MCNAGRSNMSEVQCTELRPLVSRGTSTSGGGPTEQDDQAVVPGRRMCITIVICIGGRGQATKRRCRLGKEMGLVPWGTPAHITLSDAARMARTRGKGRACACRAISGAVRRGIWGSSPSRTGLIGDGFGAKAPGHPPRGPGWAAVGTWMLVGCDSNVTACKAPCFFRLSLKRNSLHRAI